MKYLKATFGFKSGNEKTFFFPSETGLEFLHEQIDGAQATPSGRSAMTLINFEEYGVGLSWDNVEWFEAELIQDGEEEELEPCKDNEKKNITRNSAKCLKCGDEIESKSVHDFKQCSCKNIFVDGGLDYLRHGFEVFSEYQDTSE